MRGGLSINTKERRYLAVFMITLALVFWANLAYEPETWEKTFQRNDARAYGGQIVYELLPHLMEGASVEAVDAPPYEVVSDTTLHDINYVFITDNFFPDDVETDALLDFAARGNVVFAAAENFEAGLLKRLGLSLEYNLVYADSINLTGRNAGDSTRINLVNEQLATEDGYFYSNELLIRRLLLQPDGLSDELAGEVSHTVLGTYLSGDINFIRVGVGEGFLLLSMAPLAFTNYNLLRADNAAYVFAALSYMPAQTTLWDRYYKPGKITAQTPLRYVLSSPALKTAYGLGMIVLLLFVVIQVQRKQRPIPVIEPPKNRTVEFAHTVGRLYFNRGDHTNLAGKMLEQFRHYVQHRLNLPVTNFASVAAERVAARSGVAVDEVRELLAFLGRIEGERRLEESVLQELSRRLEAFYAKATR